MRKIPMLFSMEFDEKGNRIVTHTMNPVTRNLLENAHDVVATLKKDGTAVMLDENGNWFSRRCVKPGKKAPEGFIPLETDENTSKTFGWEPAENNSFNKMLTKAINNAEGELTAGTYELVGPKINGNPENVDRETLLRHGEHHAEGFPSVEDILTFEGDLYEHLEPIFVDFKERGIEGVVWWADGTPVVKLRVTDFFPERR